MKYIYMLLLLISSLTILESRCAYRRSSTNAITGPAERNAQHLNEALECFCTHSVVWGVGLGVIITNSQSIANAGKACCGDACGTCMPTLLAALSCGLMIPAAKHCVRCLESVHKDAREKDYMEQILRESLVLHGSGTLSVNEGLSQRAFGSVRGPME